MSKDVIGLSKLLSLYQKYLFNQFSQQLSLYYYSCLALPTCSINSSFVHFHKKNYLLPTLFSVWQVWEKNNYIYSKLAKINTFFRVPQLSTYFDFPQKIGKYMVVLNKYIVQFGIRHSEKANKIFKHLGFLNLGGNF